LYAPPNLYKYAPPGIRKKARTAMVELKLKLDRVRYGHSSNCMFRLRIDKPQTQKPGSSKEEL